MKFLIVSNLFLNKSAANCIQSRAMVDALARRGSVSFYFKDNSIFLFRVLRTLFASVTNEIVYTRSYIIALLCSFARIKCIYELHEIHLSRRYEWLCGSDKLLVVCISQMLRHHLEQLIAPKYLHIVSVQDGCDIKLIESLKAHENLQDLSVLSSLRCSKKILLHTGSSYKFHPHRFNEIIAQLPDTWIFVHLGGVEPNVVESFLGDDRIAFLPECSHEEAVASQLNADCLLYLNFPESRMYEYTSPLKLFEYIATARPMISTRGGATDEVIDTLKEVGEYERIREYLTMISQRDLSSVLIEQSDELMSAISWDSRVGKILQSYKTMRNDAQ